MVKVPKVKNFKRDTLYIIGQWIADTQSYSVYRKSIPFPIYVVEVRIELNFLKELVAK